MLAFNSRSSIGWQPPTRPLRFFQPSWPVNKHRRSHLLYASSAFFHIFFKHQGTPSLITSALTDNFRYRKRINNIWTFIMVINLNRGRFAGYCGQQNASWERIVSIDIPLPLWTGTQNAKQKYLRNVSKSKVLCNMSGLWNSDMWTVRPFWNNRFRLRVCMARVLLLHVRTEPYDKS